MSRVFISYKRADKEKVFPLKDKIEAAIGEPCWIDLDGIESDAQFVNVIMQAIDDAEIFLFMYSKEHSCITDYEKDWTVREINYAQDQGKRIVFVNIDKTPLTKWFKFMFGLKQQVDATSYETCNAMLRDLQKWLCIVPQKCKINKEKSVENLHSTINIVSNNKLQGEHIDTDSRYTIHKKNASLSWTKRPVLYVSIGCLIVLMLAVIIGISLLSKPNQNQVQDSNIPDDLNSMRQRKKEELPIDSLYYGTEGLKYKYDYKTMTASVRRGRAYSYQVVIPERVIYKDTIFIVNCIEDSAFYDSSIETIILPSSITSIGKGAFCKCKKMVSVNIPNDVKSIADYTFNDCECLMSICMPNGITSIGDSAFSNCKKLTSIDIPKSVRSIGKYAFVGTKIDIMDIPNQVEVIGEKAFMNLPYIKYKGKALGKPWGARSVNGYREKGLIYSDNTKKTLLACIYSYNCDKLLIPNTVTHIGEYAFLYCDNIKHIEIPNSVKSIGKSAFCLCGITSVLLPNTICSIEDFTFMGTSLVSIEIPNSVETIKQFAFYGCRHLVSVKFPRSVKRIEYEAFAFCDKLLSVEIPAETEIGKDAFFHGILEKCEITRY